MKLLRKLGKIVCSGLLAFCFIIGSGQKIEASSFSMSASTSSVRPGQSFTVTISGNDCTGRVNLSASNGSVSPSSVWVENGSVSATVTAGSSGSVTVTATPQTGFSDGNGDPYNPGSRSVECLYQAKHVF